MMLTVKMEWLVTIYRTGINKTILSLLQTLEPGEFMLYTVDFNVLFWLDSRDFLKKEKLQRKDDFVIVNNELEKEFDIFRQSIDRNFYYIPANDLLYYWYDIEQKKSPVTVNQFGKEYFKLTSANLDDFFAWLELTRESGLRLRYIT